MVSISGMDLRNSMALMRTLARVKAEDPLSKLVVISEAKESDGKMVDEIGKFWVVVRPTQDSELSDTLFETDVAGVALLGRGGLEPKSIMGIFSKEAKAKKMAEEALEQRDKDLGDVAGKHGFDFTDIKATAWKKVLKAMKIGDTPVRSPDGWKWMGPDIMIVTGNDPITGKYFAQGEREDQADYASAIGIEGKGDLVLQAADMIKKLGNPKGESPGDRQYI